MAGRCVPARFRDAIMAALYDDYRDARDFKCNRNGKCTVTYYDRRYDK